MTTRVGALGLVGTVLLSVACGSRAPGDGPGVTVVPPGVVNPSSTRSMLQRMRTCEDVEKAVKQDAKEKMNRRIDAELAMRRYWAKRYGPSRGGVGTGVGGAAPEASESANDSSASGSDKAGSYSETNTQVKGIDEADVVKTDGKYLYVLHGGSLVVLHAWPAPELAQASSVPIEGQPSEMFVAEGKVVVFSSVDGRPVYEAAGVKPRGEYSDAYYSFGGKASADMAYPGGYFGDPLTKVTVLSLDGPQATVQRELYFEGRYLSSRRVGKKVRMVLQGGAHGPAVRYWPEWTSSFNYPDTEAEWTSFYESLRAQNLRSIEASVASDWLPYEFERTGDSTHAHVKACDELWVPPVGSTEYGLTQVEQFELDVPGKKPEGQAILGRADTIYSSFDALYLASNGWLDPWTGALANLGYLNDSDLEKRVPKDTRVTLNFTHLHKFDLKTDPASPVYVASGTVPGQIDDQFSMDEKDGVLRVSTTERQAVLNPSDRNAVGLWGNGSVNNLFTLREGEDGLASAGAVRGLAPGERIFSTRFVGGGSSRRASSAIAVTS